MEKKVLDKALIIILILIIIILSFFVLKPLLSILALSIIIAYTFNPIYLFFLRTLKSRSLSSLLVTLLVLLVIFLPIFFLTPTLIREVKNIYTLSKKINFSGALQNIFHSKFSEETTRLIDLQFNNLVDRIFKELAEYLENFLYTQIYSVFLGVIIFFFVFYYLIQNLEEISRELLNFLPLKAEIAEKFAYEFKNVTSSVIYGQVILGIVQGLLMGLFLFIIGFENTLFFTLIGIIAGILPIVGPSLVWIPSSIIFLTRGQVILAIIFIIYGSFVGWFIDGFLRPYIISEKTILSIPLSFLGTIGGIYSFGMIGIIIGPLVIAYLILILNFYKEGKFNQILKE